MSVLGNILILAGLMAVLWYLPRGRWTGCRCKRERSPWFAIVHDREWVMGLLGVGFLLGGARNALTGHTLDAVVYGLVGVLELRVLHEHRKGKRSILGRLLGRVVITEHGRLATVTDDEGRTR